MKTLALGVLSLAVAFVTAEAEKPDDPNILVELQIVSMPRKLASPVVQELMSEAKAEDACRKVQEMIASGTAQLLGWPIVITRSGQRAQVEAIREIRYPTEFESGGVQVKLADKDGTVPEAAKELTGIYINAVPTAFETRNVGITLVVEPVLADDQKTILLNLVPQHVWFRGMHKVTIEHVRTKEKVVVEQPDFDVMKTQTSLTMKNGARVLLAIFPMAEPADYLELFILHVETRKP